MSTTIEKREQVLRDLVISCQKISNDLPALERIAAANELIAATRFTLDGMLPSGHQIDDHCFLSLWETDLTADILAVHFYPGKVKYDLAVQSPLQDGETRIYNVDSAFVSGSIEQ